MDPMMRDCELLAADGYALAATRFDPPAGVAGRAAVLVAGATAVKRGYYAKFAKFLASRGHPVLSFDYRGVGGSLRGHPKRLRASMADWGRYDLEAAIRSLRAEFPDRPLQLVGHSVAGQVLPLAASAGEVSAALLVASQSGAARHWRGRSKVRLAAFWYALVPLTVGLHGYLPGYAMGSEPLPAGIAREWARWGRHPEYILGHHPELRERFRALRFPLRDYAFPDDFFAPRAAVAELVSWYGGPAEVRMVAPADIGTRAIGHFGFFRESFAPTLWTEAADWLARQIPAEQAA